jgi:hypothetical protein
MRPLYLLPIILSSCVIMPTPQPKPEPIVHSLPAPVYPDECVANWYAKTALPPCVESWITDVTKEQKVIARKHKKKSPHKAVLLKQ